MCIRDRFFEGVLKAAKFCLQTCFFCKWICKKFRGWHKKCQKYFQIEEDGLVLCKKISVDLLSIVFQCNANWHGNFQRKDFGVNPKWPWKFPGLKFARGNTNNHRNFHGQHFNAVNRKWRRKFPKAESGVDPKWPSKFPTSKLWLMQNDDWNFQRKHFESSKWPWKFPTSKLWVIQDDRGNFQIQIWS